MHSPQALSHSQHLPDLCELLNSLIWQKYNKERFKKIKGSRIVSCQVSELKLLMEETDNCQSWQRDLLLMAVSHLLAQMRGDVQLGFQAPAALVLAGLFHEFAVLSCFSHVHCQSPPSASSKSCQFC